MSDFAMISQAVPQVFTLYNMLLIFGGLILGMVIGCVPGLSVTLGIILMLPLTYTFSDPASAIILLLAVYVGGMYGDSYDLLMAGSTVGFAVNSGRIAVDSAEEYIKTLK